jgi:hypothetical protein
MTLTSGYYQSGQTFLYIRVTLKFPVKASLLLPAATSQQFQGVGTSLMGQLN